MKKTEEKQKSPELSEEKELLQWHPAFYATAQIELQEEAEYLV